MVEYNKKSIYIFFVLIQEKFKLSINDFCKELNLHKGTINRWILKKEVPPIYFNSLNKMVNFKYQLNLSKKDLFKINDMFFTPVNEAKRLTNKALEFIKNNWDIDLNKCNFIEPSVGHGSFYDAIEFKNKIGIDLNTKDKRFLNIDYFDFIPRTNNNIIIGNPPFGLRGNLALKFINHSSQFSDFICMILPPLFNSGGKGSPMLRINKNFYLAKEFKVNDNNFNYPDGDKVLVNSIFQIWTKKFSSKIKPINPPKKVSEWIKIYSLSNGELSSTKRNVKMINKCDFYLPSTTFNKIQVKKSFEELPHNRGYGIVFLKSREKLWNIVEKINWQNVSFKSTNAANNLRSDIIIQEIERYL